jgi:hypothetical protein
LIPVCCREVFFNYSSCYFYKQTHTPAIARGFSLIDCNDTYWKNGFCPYRIRKMGLTGSSANLIERVDHGAVFYKKFFFGQGKQSPQLDQGPML